MTYHGFFVLLWSDWGNSIHDIRKKKKRYAYLVERKPEKFLNCVQG